MLFSYVSIAFYYLKAFVLNTVNSFLSYSDTSFIEYLYLFGYTDLLVDISEGFGIWIVILILFVWYTVLTSLIQQYNKPFISGSKSAFMIIPQKSSTSTVQYQNFLKHLSKTK